MRRKEFHHTLQVRVTEPVHRWLKRLARTKRSTVSDVARDILCRAKSEAEAAGSTRQRTT